MTDWPFGTLPKHTFATIVADPPWRFLTRSDKGKGRSADRHYSTMDASAIKALPVSDLACDDAVLVLWVTWPFLAHGLALIDAWGFTYKTCAFDWMKADVSTIDLFNAPKDADMKMGYWTRSNSEPALLATRGHPKRRDAGVRMGIIEPARQHSRKPDCVHGRIERLVGGPYLELFARQSRPGWSAWGNETTKFGAAA